MSTDDDRPASSPRGSNMPDWMSAAAASSPATRAALTRSSSSSARSRACRARPSTNSAATVAAEVAAAGASNGRRVEQQTGLKAPPAGGQRGGDPGRGGGGHGGDRRPWDYRPSRQRQHHAQNPIRRRGPGRLEKSFATQQRIDRLRLHEHARLPPARRGDHVRRAGGGQAHQHDLALEQVVRQAPPEQVRRRSGLDCAPVPETEGEASVRRRGNPAISNLDRAQPAT